MANEMIDFWRCSKMKGIILKLDLEKAFDKLYWNFLLNVLAFKGFNKKWITWIRGCISSMNGKLRNKVTAGGSAKKILYLPFYLLQQWTTSQLSP